SLCPAAAGPGSASACGIPVPAGEGRAGRFGVGERLFRPLQPAARAAALLRGTELQPGQGHVVRNADAPRLATAGQCVGMSLNQSGPKRERFGTFFEATSGFEPLHRGSSIWGCWGYVRPWFL